MATTLTVGSAFQINSNKIYISVLTLPVKDNITFLENMKQGNKRTVSWNKYRSDVTTQPKNDNSD